jgi:RNA polymerase sigma-70 factor (ECF subfamily)
METVLTAEAAPVLLDDFDIVVRQHQARIFRFVLACIRDRESAENLTQECLLRAYRARGRFRGEASPSTWLMQIAVNLVRSHMASSRLKFWRKAERSAVDLSSVEDWLADPQLSPEAQVLARQRVAAVWEAAGALPERQRTVFLLRFVEEMELLEIAAATGMKEGTVKAHLFRAVESVRRRIEGKR